MASIEETAIIWDLMSVWWVSKPTFNHLCPVNQSLVMWKLETGDIPSSVRLCALSIPFVR